MALAEALERYGQTRIFNTDQGSEFTRLQFTGVLNDVGCRHLYGRPGSMHGQHLHRALLALVKYEWVNLHEFTHSFVAQRVMAQDRTSLSPIIWSIFYVDSAERRHV